MNTLDLERIWEGLSKWSDTAVTQFGAAKVYVFGSLVYRDGAQFVQSSDVDLVIELPSHLTDALSRAKWLETFYEHKQSLEVTLLGLLGRQMVEPFASIVPVTGCEIELDIHKDNQRDFFSENVFVNALEKQRVEGLPGAGSGNKQCDRLLASCIGFTQKMRNQFLAVAANSRNSVLLPYSGEDPISKPIMRAAAMARRLQDQSLEKGAEYDTRMGMDLLARHLYDLQKIDERYQELNDLISERRRGRGPGGPLTEADQLLLAEIVFDIALGKAKPSPQGVDINADGAGSAQPKEDSSATQVSKAQEPSSQKEIGESEGEPSLKGESSLVFFYNRFMDSFPGVRDVTWFDEPADAIKRLERLLRPPVRFSDGVPIWWWRGERNLQIEHFERLDSDVVLIDCEEHKIRRIAAIPGKSYKWHFVYVETSAMEPTGLYNLGPEVIDEILDRRGYVDEEYGLYKGQHLISREQYDDGGTEIEGEYVDTTGNTKLRVRYVTPYNFVIAAQDSPINNVKFDSKLAELLNSALNTNAKKVIEKLKEEVNYLPLRR